MNQIEIIEISIKDNFICQKIESVNEMAERIGCSYDEIVCAQKFSGVLFPLQDISKVS